MSLLPLSPSWRCLFVFASFGAVLAFDAPKAPPAMASVEHAFDHADLSKAPPMGHFTARDGTRLVFRAYPGSTRDVVVLVHGSSGTSASMLLQWRKPSTRAAPPFMCSGMRGHDGTGRSGDIDYIGQLDDDVVDFMKTLGPKHRRGSAGRSWDSRPAEDLSCASQAAQMRASLDSVYSGIAAIARELTRQCDPMPAAGSLRRSPRIIALRILSRAGIHNFEGSAGPRLRGSSRKCKACETAFYSYRMFRNFGPTGHYLEDLRRAPGPVVLLAGANDEIFYSDRYAALLKPVAP